jgi:hypothetical protein
MARPKTASLIRQALMPLAIAATGLLAACGPGQGSSSTTVVLTGPPDKVDALIVRHKLLGSPVQAQMEKLDDGRERARFHLSKGLPMGEVIALGKDAANTGVSYEFSSGAQWGSGDPPPVAPQPGDPTSSPPARSGGGPVV